MSTITWHNTVNHHPAQNRQDRQHTAESGSFQIKARRYAPAAARVLAPLRAAPRPLMFMITRPASQGLCEVRRQLSVVLFVVQADRRPSRSGDGPRCRRGYAQAVSSSPQSGPSERITYTSARSSKVMIGAA